MADVSIAVKVDPKLAKQLDPKQYTQALKRAMSPATKIVLDRVQIYPPRIPGSRYIRTGNLRRSWVRKIKESGGNVVGVVRSNPSIARYNVYVKHPTLQAGVHRGRWPTTEADAKAVGNEVRSQFERAINAVLK